MRSRWGCSPHDEIVSIIRGWKDQSSHFVLWGYNKKVTVCKLGRGLSARSNHAGTLILDFYPPELLNVHKCLLFKLTVYDILLMQTELRQVLNIARSQFEFISISVTKMASLNKRIKYRQKWCPVLGRHIVINWWFQFNKKI